MASSIASGPQGSGTPGPEEPGGHANKRSSRAARILVRSLAVALSSLVAGTITTVVVLNVKLRKYKVKRYPLTPERKALIAEAHQLYRSRTPKDEAIQRLRIMSGGDRSELWAASTRIRVPLRNNHEASAVTVILVEAARPYSEANHVPANAWKLPEPSSEEWRLTRLPREEAFAELLELEPRLSEAMAVAHAMSGEMQPVASRISAPRHTIKALTAKQRAAHKRLLSMVTPIAGAKSNATSPLLRTNAAAAVALMHLEDVAGIHFNDDYWTR
jgi:hypothetical protein